MNMTDTTQTESKNGKASDWTTAALAGVLGALLIVLGATSHFYHVNEQVSMVLSLVLVGASLAALWNWTRNCNTDSSDT